MSRVGFLSNPIAGMGGRVGLKGTDGVVREAIELGARPTANEKARETLEHIRQLLLGSSDDIQIHWVTCSGTMGVEALTDSGFTNLEVVHLSKEPTVDQRDPYYSLTTPNKSIGRMCTFFGNFGMFVRAYAYVRAHGAEGLRQNSMHAVLNANYLRVKLRDVYTVPFDRVNMHEFVCQGRIEGSNVHALDISKRLMDYGFHPPTNYFPLIVPEALMIEPTETESKQTLDAFIAAMREIAREATQEPELLRTAPHQTPAGRLDEVKAARQPVLRDTAC